MVYLSTYIFAHKFGHKHLVQSLVESDANANTGSSLPLHIAAENGKCQLTEVLLEHGANVNAIDDYGDTALHHAIDDDDSIVHRWKRTVKSR